MNNGLKALLIAASTIITCMIVTLGFALAKEAKQIGNQVTGELSRYQTAVTEQDDMKYDGVTVYGNDIRNLLRRRLHKETKEVAIRVFTEEGEQLYQTEEDADAAGDETSDRYIAPFDEYEGAVQRNENDVIVEVQFRKRLDKTNN